ncbi:MAG: YggT family protein [Pseudomonadota bacterium]|nr:YggT family protein [Pseudomonadota bacterium]
MIDVVLQIIAVLLDLLALIIVVQAIMSWLIAFNVINTWNEPVRAIWEALRRITEPVYRPIRRFMPDFGALDLSPLVALIIIQILLRIVLPYIATVLYGGSVM